MEDYNSRKKKSTKAKEKYDKYGKNTNKHIRSVEQLKNKKKSL